MIKLKKKEHKTIKSNKLKKYREKWLNQQNDKCPLLGYTINPIDAVIDHQHKRKKDPIGVNNDGYIRGVIHNQANSLEGKISKAYKRTGVHKLIDLPSFLRNLANYLENSPLINKKIVHPSELPKRKELGKRNFNKWKKYYFDIHPNKKKFPGWPKSNKLTDQIQNDLNKIKEFLK